MDYKDIKYMHIERLGTDEVKDLLIGKVHIFPKIDGTNGVIWQDPHSKKIMAGSRNRVLSLDKDNANFYSWVENNQNIYNYFNKYPNDILYGEWLVPHTIQTYRENCWNDFYIFDVGVMENEKCTAYLPYSIYQKKLEEFNLTYLSPLKIVKDPTIEELIFIAENNFYLMRDGEIGEGIVCKNYDFYNEQNNQIWGKLVRNEFKESHYKTMGAPESYKLTIEEQIVDKFITQSLVDKEYSKIKVSNGGKWVSRLIPTFLNNIFYCLINEEMWHILKEFSNPTIDFKKLQHYTYKKIKEMRKDIF